MGNNGEKREEGSRWLIPASILLAAGFLGFSMIYSTGLKTRKAGPAPFSEVRSENLIEGETVLLIRWGDLGARLTTAGVIDQGKFLPLYPPEMAAEAGRLLTSGNKEELSIRADNAGLWLNLLWALGLGNKNEILEKGEMTNPAYGSPAYFASTGGWTVARNDPMDHYSAHDFIVLTADQQKLVAKISENIYRPCCDNSTHFPDCNHGMAMLGLLELLASQGADENRMYQAALAMNSFWFPEQYEIIGRYLASRNQSLESSDPRSVLGRNFSSSSGFQLIASLAPREKGTEQSGGSCGV